MRQETKSRNTFTVVSTMKNEGPFILEWVAHYKTLGFDEIVVCTNDCEDATVPLLKALEERNLVRHHATKIRTGGIHRSALRQATRYEEVTEADWVFICDVDEFLNIHVGDGSVRALVERSGPDADVISVPWRVFGPDGLTLFRDRRVTRQFEMAEPQPRERPEVGKFVKSLYRPDPERIKRAGLHAPVFHDDSVGAANIVLPGGEAYVRNGQRTETPPSFDVAQVNHYALRTLDSFLIKRDRGRANHQSHVLGVDYWNRFNHNDRRDESIRRYDDGVDEWMERFLSDPQLHRLHRKSVRWHRAKARELRQRPEFKSLVADIKKTLTTPSKLAARAEADS